MNRGPGALSASFLSAFAPVRYGDVVVYNSGDFPLTAATVVYHA